MGPEEWKSELRRVLGARGDLAVRLQLKGQYRSKVDPELLEAWARRTGDPETAVPEWLRQGAPFGIERDIETCGVFPPSKEALKGSTELPDGFSQAIRGDLVNYKTVEENKELAKEELDRLVTAGYAVRGKVDDTEVKTLSKLGLILKTKEDGTLKKRLVIDLKRSGGNDKSRLPERLVLPRILDGVEMIRDLKRCHPHPPTAPEVSQHWGMELVLIDISDAFMSLAVHPDEWPHCISPSTEPGEIVTFVALLFGFKTAPLLYSRLGAMVARFLQACIDPTKALHQVYLDDSLWALQGMLWERNQTLAFLLYTMAALGLKVAFKKGERACSLQWIGVKFSVVNNTKVVLTLPEKFMDDRMEQQRVRSHQGVAIGDRQAELAVRGVAKGTMGYRRILRGPLLSRGDRRGAHGQTPRALPGQAVGAGASVDAGQEHRQPSTQFSPPAQRDRSGHHHHGRVAGSIGSDPRDAGRRGGGHLIASDGGGLSHVEIREGTVELARSGGRPGNLCGATDVEGEAQGTCSATYHPERLHHGVGAHSAALELQPGAQLLGSRGGHSAGRARDREGGAAPHPESGQHGGGLSISPGQVGHRAAPGHFAGAQDPSHRGAQGGLLAPPYTSAGTQHKGRARSRGPINSRPPPPLHLGQLHPTGRKPQFAGPSGGGAAV